MGTTVVQVTARPATFTLDVSSTVVLVVDMQHDFASPGGMFHRAGIDIAAVRRIVEPIARVLTAARSVSLPVVYLKMGFDADLADAGYPTAPTWLKHAPLDVGAEVAAPDGTPSRILVRGTWNTEIVPELAPADGDLVVEKHRYSGFFGTDLEAALARRGIESLVVVGATTSVCVESTVRDAMFRDLHCLVLRDCTAEPIGADLARSNHEASLLTLELLFAHTADSEDVISALAAARADLGASTSATPA